MPAVLTHKAIMMMSLDRLRDIRRRVKTVQDQRIVAGTPTTDLERKILRLADLAIKAMEEPSGADSVVRTFTGTVNAGVNPVSRFAVMGSMGPDITGFSEAFNPGQTWVFDTLHKGTPDYNRDLVNAGTTDLALRIYARAADLAATQITDGAARARHLNRVRAYVMGHLTHLAADIVSHPYINDLEWHPGTDDQAHRPHGDNEKAIDAAVAQTLFGKGGIRTGVDGGWQKWWPADDAIHSSFYDAYAKAFADTYGDTPRESFADWETYLATQKPPELSADFIRHGYRTLRGFGIGVGYDLPMGAWYGMLSLVFLPLIAMPWVAWGLPHSRDFFETPQGEDLPSSERTAFELVTAPLGICALGPLVMGSMLLPFAARGTEGRAVTGVVMQSLAVAGFLTMAIEAAKIDHPTDGIPPWARWLFIFCPHVFSGLIFGGMGLEDHLAAPKHPRPFNEPVEDRRKLIDLLHALPLAGLVAWGLWLLMLWAIKAGEGGAKSAIRMGSLGFILTTVIWMLGMLALWIWLPFKLRGTQVPDTPAADDPALQRHGLRMFDDSTLWTDPTQTDERLKQVYPSDIRPLLRLWWTGPGKMDIRVDRISVTFRPKDGDAQVIPAPIAPLTPAEFLQHLKDVVTDKNGATGGLQGELFDAADAGAAYPLPSGATFAAHGDHEHDADDIAAGLTAFKPLNKKNNDKSYILYHAAKPMQAVHMGRTGTFSATTSAALATAEAGLGFDYVTNPALDGARPAKLMTHAAELGAMLCMGAAGHIGAGAADSDKVYQVFRNWSLDRRRINEWKMLIAGKAKSDKVDPAAYDTAMPGGDLAPAGTWTAPVKHANAGVLTEAESTARDLGWINVMDAWLKVYESGRDITGTEVDSPTDPTPRALSRAMAYIFDTTDPAGGAM